VDANVGQMPGAVEKTGVRENTIVIFTSDNGLEFIRPGNGWAGPWRGHCFMT
jgi:arylsulfatase